MSDPYSGKPSLDDVRARVERANEHIMRLKLESSNLARAAIYTDEGGALLSIPTGMTGKLTNTTHTKSVPAGGYPAPPIAAILVGETIYNLRAALDYLVYNLAILDSGKPQDGTQFPLVSSPKKWCEAECRCLSGLDQRHKAQIKGLQPFAGFRWANEFRELSNADKHRFLVFSGALISRGMTISEFTVDTDTGEISETIQAVPAVGHEPVNVDGEAIFGLRFGDGRPVVELLQEMEAGVRNILDVFEPDFGGGPRRRVHNWYLNLRSLLRK